MDPEKLPVLTGDPDQLLTQEQLSALLGGVPIRTIRDWTAKGTGIPAIRLGKHTRYRVGDYREWLAAKRAEAGPAA